MRKWGIAASLIVLISPAWADFARTLTGPAAYGDWRIDVPGLRFRITPADLPAPKITPTTTSTPIIAPRPKGSKPRAPVGFIVDSFATGLNKPTTLREAPNGDIFVTESGTGHILILRGNEGDTPAPPQIFTQALDQPHGLAFYPTGPQPQFLYMATRDAVVRLPYKVGDLTSTAKPEKIITLPQGGLHDQHDLAVSADNSTLYVSQSSASNDGQDMGLLSGLEAFRKTHSLGATWGSEAGRADVLAFHPDGSALRIFATGLRNCAGLTFEPHTAALWCVVQERDGLGETLPPDFATSVGEGKFYGWPWFYIGDHEQPQLAKQRPDLSGQVTLPEVLLQPHAQPTSIVFYTASHFPPPYRGSAFVTLQGSWNNGKPAGYKVVRLVFENGRPTGEYEDFLTNFLSPKGEIWGRPTGLLVTHSGDLLVSDEETGIIWRVRATGD